MKFITKLLLIPALCVLVFSSCKKDKAEPQIHGKWFYDKIEFNDHVDGEDNEDIEEFSGEDAFIQFNADGTFTAISMGQGIAGTWVKNGNTITVTATIEGDQQVVEIEIKTLTEKALVIYQKFMSDDESGDYSESTTYLYKL